MQYNIIDLILTYLELFFDNLFIHCTKMIKKILYRAFYKKRSLNLDARFWIQKILLQKQYCKKIY